MFDAILVAFYACSRRIVGLVNRPYETYRAMMEKSSLWELFPLGVLVGLYLAISSLVKTAAFRPFVLTRHFIKTSGSVVVTFLFVTVLLWGVARLWGGRGAYKHIVLGWAYTLIPTCCWFFFTSILYMVLPPPRTTQMTGVSLSVVFLTISAVLLFWKIILGYLTLRFGMKMDLVKILLTVCVVAPIIGLYSVGMYRLGIFRIPFL